MKKEEKKLNQESREVANRLGIFIVDEDIIEWLYIDNSGNA